MRSAGKLILEVVVLCGLGLGLGLAVNSLRAQNSLRIGRNYFAKPKVAERPREPRVVATAPSANLEADAAAPAGTSGAGARTPPVDPSVARTETTPADSAAPEKGRDSVEDNWLGIQVLEFDEMRDIFEDAAHRAGTCIFVDARGDDLYADGRIPRAIQIDHYNLEDYLPGVLPQLRLAERIVVYCNGGDCEDSLFVCQDLLDAGIRHDKLALYKGGFEEWEEKDMPIEKDDE